MPVRGATGEHQGDPMGHAEERPSALGKGQRAPCQHETLSHRRDPCATAPRLPRRRPDRQMTHKDGMDQRMNGGSAFTPDAAFTLDEVGPPGQCDGAENHQRRRDKAQPGRAHPAIPIHETGQKQHDDRQQDPRPRREIKQLWGYTPHAPLLLRACAFCIRAMGEGGLSERIAAASLDGDCHRIAAPPPSRNRKELIVSPRRPAVLASWEARAPRDCGLPRTADAARSIYDRSHSPETRKRRRIACLPTGQANLVMTENNREWRSESPPPRIPVHSRNV